MLQQVYAYFKVLPLHDIKVFRSSAHTFFMMPDFLLEKVV